MQDLQEIKEKVITVLEMLRGVVCKLEQFENQNEKIAVHPKPLMSFAEIGAPVIHELAGFDCFITEAFIPVEEMLHPDFADRVLPSKRQSGLLGVLNQCWERGTAKAQNVRCIPLVKKALRYVFAFPQFHSFKIKHHQTYIHLGKGFWTVSGELPERHFYPVMKRFIFRVYRTILRACVRKARNAHSETKHYEALCRAEKIVSHHLLKDQEVYWTQEFVREFLTAR